MYQWHFDVYSAPLDLSPASHCGRPCSIPGRSMLNAVENFGVTLSIIFHQCSIFILIQLQSILYNLNTECASLNQPLKTQPELYYVSFVLYIPCIVNDYRSLEHQQMHRSTIMYFTPDWLLHVSA